jgi:predicted DNA-binding transcriptional regulator AlpA
MDHPSYGGCDQHRSFSFSFADKQEAIMQKEITRDVVAQKILLGVEDMMLIYDWSRVTVYRKVRDVRAGISQSIPPPISGYKEKLKWSAASVEEHLKARATPLPPVDVGSPTKHAKEKQQQRQATAATLARHGIGSKSTTAK